jgi:hypothetical protein
MGFAAEAELEKKAIEDIAQLYVQAFDNKDLPQLKRVVSPEFLESLGGEKNLVEQWKAVPERKGRQVDDILFFALGDRYFFRFQVKSAKGKVEETMGDEEWFQLRKVDGKSWRIVSKESDFAQP